MHPTNPDPLGEALYRATGCSPAHPVFHRSDALACDTCGQIAPTARYMDHRHVLTRVCAACLQRGRERVIGALFVLAAVAVLFALAVAVVVGVVTR